MTTDWLLTLGRQACLVAPDGRRWALDGVAALLALRLALAGPQPRDLLARQLWPGVPAARARGNLRQRLLRLKNQAGHAWVQGTDTLALQTPVQRLGAELLLPDLHLPTDDELGLWLDDARRRWRQAHIDTLQQQLQAAELAGRLDDALRLAVDAISLQPEAEAPRRELARLHYLAHDRARALQELDALDAMLARVHGTAPSSATLALRQLVAQAPSRAAGAGRNATLAPPAGTAVPLSTALQRPPRLIGRAGALSELQRALQPGQVVLLLGEAGMGKSRLIAEAMNGRPHTLIARAHAGDEAAPHAALGRLLRQLLAERPRLASPALAPLLPDLAGNATAPHSPAAQHQALVQLWCASGVQTTVLDDLHFADTASIETLRLLMQDEALAGHAWVLATRPAEMSPAAQALREALTAERRLHPLALAPLDEASVAQLLDSLALKPPTPDWPQRLHRHTGGNPFFLLEALRHAGHEPGAQAGLGLTPTVQALLAQRLARLSPDALALARVAAVAGADFDPLLASAVLQRPVLALADAWAALEAAQVLQGQAFTHDLMAAATRQGLAAPIAAQLHAAVAQHLSQTATAAPAHLAAHWLAAKQPAQALPWLERAADQAHRQWRPVEEARFLSQIAELLEALDPARLPAVLLKLAGALVEAQGFEPATVPLERALHVAAEGPERLRALLMLADIQFNRLMPEASARTAEQAQQLARALQDTPRLAEAVLRRHRALCMAGRAAEGEALWAAEQGWMAGHEFSAELTSDRGWVLDRLGRPQEARRWHARGCALARAQGRPVDEAVVLGNEAQSMLLAGEPAAAHVLLDRIDALNARHEGLHDASDYLAVHRAFAAAQQAHYGQALQHLDRALGAAGQQSGAAHLAVLAHRAMVWAMLGQRSRALADAAEVLRHPALPPWMVSRAHHALALASHQPSPSGWQRTLEALNDPAQRALDGPPRLRALLLAEPGHERDAWCQCRQWLHVAVARQHAGLRWLAHWAAAQLAARAGLRLAARRHARACLARPPGQVALLLPDGQWWHGLWQVGLALGDRTLARDALHEGRRWVQATRTLHVPAPFQASFCDAIPEHQALLAAAP